jgi:hypothetical protein
MSTPTVAKSIEKVVGGILGIDFPGNILMSSDSFQNLQSNEGTLPDVNVRSTSYFAHR